MKVTIKRSAINTIPASEMEVGQVARIKTDPLDVFEPTTSWKLDFLIERREHDYFSGTTMRSPAGMENLMVEPVQTVSLTPKAITPSEMKDGDIGEIGKAPIVASEGKIVQKHGDDLVAICKDYDEGFDGVGRSQSGALKILPLQPGDSLVIGGVEG